MDVQTVYGSKYVRTYLCTYVYIAHAWGWGGSILSPPFHSWHWQLAKIDNQSIRNSTIQSKGYDTIETIQYNTIDMITMNDTYTNDDIERGLFVFYHLCVWYCVVVP